MPHVHQDPSGNALVTFHPGGKYLIRIEIDLPKHLPRQSLRDTLQSSYDQGTSGSFTIAVVSNTAVISFERYAPEDAPYLMDRIAKGRTLEQAASEQLADEFEEHQENHRDILTSVIHALRHDALVSGIQLVPAPPAVNEDAALLRAQALALLERAAALDGLQPFMVIHDHECGMSGYIGWFATEPTETQAAAILDAAYEPERDESLIIDSSLTLQELTGVKSSQLDASHEESESDPQYPLSDEAYVQKGGGLCPFCGNEDMVGSAVEIDGSNAVQDVYCNQCDKTWSDFYKLAGYSET